MSNKYTNFVSPRGVAKYPKLDQPYSWNQKLNKSMPDPEGQYELTLVMSDKDAAPFVKLVKEAIEASGMTPTNLPYKKAVDKDTGKPTGDVELKFKAYGRTKDDKLNRIKFFDTKARPIKANLDITSGSELKVDGYVSVAKLGARLNIRGVQVLSLVEAVNSFGEEDGDFVYDDTNEESAVAEDNSEAGSDDSFDF